MLNTVQGIDVFQQALRTITHPAPGIPLAWWKRFSEFIGGLRVKEFTIFCGATGAGKTQWLANLAAQLVTSGTKIYVAPVETGHIDFSIRMMSALSRRDFNTGDAFKANQVTPCIDKHFQELNDNVIFSTHDNRVDVLEMIQTLKYMHDEKGVHVAILDNLNFFMKPTSAQNQIKEYDEVIHSFVMLAKEIPIHIILVMHPKKTDGGRIMSEFDIKGSSTAVQEASNILLMNRLTDEEIEKSRNNMTGAGPFTPYHREFVFKKLRRRGFNVNRKIYMRYEGAAYVEC